MRSANCKGTAPNLRQNPAAKDPFFPGKGESRETGQLMCFTCGVRRECDDYRRRTNSEHGMWAGVIQKRKKSSENKNVDQ